MEHIETDYKNRNAIISTFNKSAKEYKNSEMFLENKDLENAKLSLHAAANDLYQACEWSYKNFLRINTQKKKIKESSVVKNILRGWNLNEIIEII